ncbi:hypothetical protein QM364_06775 [Streptococcus anginosus]|uniref:hypothetical protein n=1 Tax=Streptococcus anginosus TaxID=1328 RepID=UPI0039C0E3AA
MVHMKINLEHFEFKAEDIKTEILEMDADHIKSRTIYPNGLILSFEQTADEISVDTNWRWKQEPDGSLTPIL